MKQRIIDLLENLLFLLMPHYWVMVQPYNRDWNNKMKQWLKDEEPILILSEYRMLVKGKEIWISNWPYGALNPCDAGYDVRPSRLTIKRWGKRIKKLKKEYQLKNLYDFMQC